MSAKFLKIDQLKLDLINPRISKASNQREAMQKIIEDQGRKLANLAESIVNEGLNPMDRLLVMKSEDSYGMHTAVAGRLSRLAWQRSRFPFRRRLSDLFGISRNLDGGERGER